MQAYNGHIITLSDLARIPSTFIASYAKESNQVTYTTQFAMLQAISWESDQTKHMFVHTLLCCYIPHLALR